MAHPRFFVVTDTETGRDFLGELLRLVADNATPVRVEVKSGSVEIGVIVFEKAAEVISVLKTIWGIRQWLRKRRNTHPESPLKPWKNRRWALEQAKSWAVLEARADPESLRVEKMVSKGGSWEFRMSDKKGRVFICKSWRTCTDHYEEVSQLKWPR